MLMIAGGLYAASRPSIYTVPVNFWTSSPTFFAVRVGILMVVLAALSFVPPLAPLEPLAALGRASLFVYWIHVELVYGLIATPLKGAFSVAGAWAALGVFCTLMLGAAVLKQWIVAKYHEHRQLRGKLRRQAQALML